MSELRTRELKPAVVESLDARRARFSAAILIIVSAMALGIGGLFAHGAARFALSDAFDSAKLPTLSFPGQSIVIFCALVALIIGIAFLTARVRSVIPLAATIAGIAVIVGFMAWAAAGSTQPFPVSNQLAGTLTLATPLIFGALCGVMCERAGVVNVAIEGQFLSAAFCAAVVGSATKSMTLALVAAVIAGVLMAALLAVFSIKYLVDQVVLGVVLNLFAAGLTGFLFDQLIKTDPVRLNNAPIMERIAIPGLSAIPLLGPILFKQTILAYLAVIAVVLAWIILYRTKWGLRIRAVGEHPKAADTVGISVAKTRWSAVLFGGVFAGLGGAFFTIGSTGSFSKDITVGNGFIALAALIMGRWHPVFAAFVALFFGFVTQLGSQVQALNTAVPSQFLLLLPYLATIIAVAGLVGKVRSPKADGQPYLK